MKPEIAKKWIAALRSGEYKQARGHLRVGSNFCCLGVLCNLHAQAHPKIAARQTNPDLYMGYSGCLPATVQAWSGMISANGALLNDTLANRNDAGDSFHKIANFIEKHEGDL